jgi:hypothetical protein
LALTKGRWLAFQKSLKLALCAFYLRSFALDSQKLCGYHS